jgi:hypothetical protein
MKRTYILFLFVNLFILQTSIVFSQEKDIVIQGDTTLNGANSGANQSSNASDIIWKPCISPFIELMGKGFFSVNVDYRWSRHCAASFGFQPFEVLLPDLMYYYLSGGKHSLEIGAGVSTGINENFKLAVVLIHGVVGYRYQKKKGLFIRGGFTPFYVISTNKPDSNKFYPFVGLSLGYSF